VQLRATRRLTLARHWQATGELDEAAHDGYRALRLVRRCRPVPGTMLAEVALTLARVERDRDEPGACLGHLDSAVSALQAAPPAPDRDRLLTSALVELGDCHRRAGRYPAAAGAAQRALRLIVAADPAAAGLLAAALTVLGIAAKELGEFGFAGRWYARVDRIHRLAGAAPADAAALAHNQAGLAYARGRWLAAERHARRAVELRRRVPGTTALTLAPDLAVLAAAVAGQDRSEQARELFGRALAAYRAAQPPRRYEIAVQLHGLASVEQSAGRLAQAERLYREALGIKERLLGAGHPEVAVLTNNLGTLLAARHRRDEAAGCYRRALAIAGRTYPPGHPVLAAVQRNIDRLAAPAVGPAAAVPTDGG
jgi:tetratricopeptide (TPR) repeat protein